MKKIFLSLMLILVSTSLMSCTQEEAQVIQSGTPVKTAIKTFNKFGYAHGTQEYGLQWEPFKGEDFVFCKLDSNKTLVLVYSTKTNRVKKLFVIADQKHRKEYPTITPTSIHFSKDSYSLIFDK